MYRWHDCAEAHRLYREGRSKAEKLAQITRKPDEQAQLASKGRLREMGPELSAALLSGPDELRRRILTRLVKRATYLKQSRDIEVVLVLPHPDVPLRLAAPDDLAAPMAHGGSVLDRKCPGAGHFLSRTRL